MNDTVEALRQLEALRMSQSLSEHQAAEALLFWVELFRELSESGDDSASEAFALASRRLRVFLGNRAICALASAEARAQLDIEEMR
jgi:hypothetical protein